MVISIVPLSAATINYVASNEDISNPDRGFYYPYTTLTSSNNFTPLDQAELESRAATPYTPFNAIYTVKSSIGLRQYILDAYVNIDILPQALLDDIQADFDTARAAGVRLLLRFSYTNTPVPGTCNAGFICPPYGDAPKARVIGHINQLSGVLKANSDVIVGLQQGFIGTWGENYYTDYFGDPSVNADQGYLTNANWQDRNEVLAALLDALPDNRMVQVRYPQAKQRYLGGPTAPLSTPAMTLSQAFDGSDNARLGIHNDCFVASVDDLGTFADYGNDASPVSSNNSSLLKQYAQDDSIYTLVGGETCADAYEPQNNCEAEGGEIIDIMARYHYSYLNSDFNNEVNNDWFSGGCMDEIKQKLGYRYVLNSAQLPDQGTIGEVINLSFNISNVGFATAVNERQLWLVLRNTETLEETKLLLDGQNTNQQFWLADTTFTVQASATLNNVDQGVYSLWLHIADASNNNRVIDRPEFSVQLANENTWESHTGYNNLNSTITVDQTDGDILDFIPAIISGSDR